MCLAQIDKLIHLTDNTYSYDDVITMEMKLLRVLNFDVHPPVATDFLDRLLMCVPRHDRVSGCLDRLMCVPRHDRVSGFQYPYLLL